MHIPFLDLGSVHSEMAEELDQAWRDVVQGSAFIGGAHVERFESQWAQYCASEHAVSVGNGTDALHLTLVALGIGAGDEVVVPANTFIATAEAVAAAGATPVFVDVDPATLLLTGDGLASALTPRTAAVIPVHLYGQMVDMDAIGRIADRAGIAVIEDAAQAHGATWRDRPAGSFGTAACFSFYPGKNLGAFGDAGAVVTSDADLADRVRMLSNHGRSLDSHHQHPIVGTNSRLDGLQAAILSVKLKRLDGWNAARRRAAKFYLRELSDLAVEPVAIASAAESVYHLFVVTLDHRDRVRLTLTESGIGTGIHYPTACHQQGAFANDRQPPVLPVAERAAGRILSLPMHPLLSETDVKNVAQALADAIGDAPEPESVRRTGSR
jgi:dTDP-4-amino-4,6-dideoxygalactose transaminase